jgi:hypothetical protein
MKLVHGRARHRCAQLYQIEIKDMNNVLIKIGDKISCRVHNNNGRIDNIRPPKIGKVTRIDGTTITFTGTNNLSFVRPASICRVIPQII